MITNREAAGVAIATSPEDADAVDAVKRHHAELSRQLSACVDAMLDVVAEPDGTAVEPARARLLGFLTDELLPHAAAEEASLYPAAATDARARLLIDGMLAEHRVIQSLVTEIADAAEPVRAAAAARAVQVLFDAHLAKENDLVVPVVAASGDTSLAAVLAGMHDILGEKEPPGGCGGSCGCGGHDDVGAPELDVRTVPHAIRHAAVFGALDAVPTGGSLVLVAPHDPVPLLDQIRARTSGAFSVTYEERGPESWRLRLNRQH
ncbi:MAG TPA: DUF2249 domain-containing protein [Jiangellaceae bacterium]|nr:DUF2249 domain-containing protein [Jiangellaceae bacterium]